MIASKVLDLIKQHFVKRTIPAHFAITLLMPEKRDITHTAPPIYSPGRDNEGDDDENKFYSIMLKAVGGGFSLSEALSASKYHARMIFHDDRYTGAKDGLSPNDHSPHLHLKLVSLEKNLSLEKVEELWKELCTELEIDETRIVASTSPEALEQNFNNVLINARNAFDHSCVVLLPITQINESRYDRFFGILNVTCRPPDDMTPEALMESLEVPLALAKSHLFSNLLHFYEDSERTANLAAVFARNFSHVIGSHVISNPDFREALFGPGMKYFRQMLEHSKQKFSDTLDTYLRLGFQQDPKTFWDEGHYVLIKAHEQFQAGSALQERARTFHEYLQGRFDFIARAIDSTQDRPEPIFFVADLLEGFLRQSAFLDILVADLGLRLSDISFTAVLPGEYESTTEAFTAYWDTTDPKAPARYQWSSQSGASIESRDKLIGLPGGMVSAHAFYSLLENIMRNSAKYGSERLDKDRKKKPFNLTLLLTTTRGSAWTLSVLDNYSRVDADALKKITDGIKGELLLNDSPLRRESLGLLEMQACAIALCNPESPKNTPGVSAGTPAAKRGNLEAHDSPPKQVLTDIDTPLVYSLSIHKPILLAVVTRRSSPPPPDTIRFFESINDLSQKGRGAHIAVIDAECIPDWREQLDPVHHLLPYRLLVVSTKSEQPCVDGKLPTRRVQFTTDAALSERLTLLSGGSGHELLNMNEQFILDCYEAWLRCWKAHETPAEGWDLWIGIERNERQVDEMWGEPIRRLSKIQERQAQSTAPRQPLVNVAIRSSQRDEAGSVESALLCTSSRHQWSGDPAREKKYWEDELSAEPNRKKALVFDNHGRCFKDAWPAGATDMPSRSTRFYQNLSGTESPDLFHQLSSPPSQSFTFIFFVYGLLESCLANIVIADERIAANLLFSSHDSGRRNQLFSAQLGNHQKSGIFPAFSLTIGPSDTEKGVHYSPAHEEALRQLDVPDNVLHLEGFKLGDLSNPQLGLLSIERHGVVAGQGTTFTCKVVSPATETDFTCDAIVIHEGVLDLIRQQPGGHWPNTPGGKKEAITSLWKIAPVVLRTSGRGRSTKYFPQTVPFIEFNEISAALLTSRNKLPLVRGLFGATGESPSAPRVD